MGVLVREISSKRAGLWAAAEDESRWVNGNFPFELLHDLFHPSGLSFYEIESTDDPNLIRVAAALYFPKKGSKTQIESFEFRTVEATEVERLGLKVSATEGMTKSESVNKLHRDVTGFTRPLAVALARLMCDRPTIPFSAAEIARAISRSIAQGELRADDLHKDMLDKLLRERAASITWAS
jgi:hypothetical protein